MNKHPRRPTRPKERAAEEKEVKKSGLQGVVWDAAPEGTECDHCGSTENVEMQHFVYAEDEVSTGVARCHDCIAGLTGDANGEEDKEA